MADARNAYKILVGETGRRRENNIINDLIEIRWEDVDWIHLPQDRDHWRALVNTVMTLRVP